MTTTDLTIMRKERKYIVMEHTFDEIREELCKSIPIHIFKGSNPYSNLETTYLDTKDLMLFREYLNRREFRYKIRLRRYGSNNVFEKSYLVELKVKYNGLSKKKRFILPEECLEDFLKGGDIKSQIKKVNKGLKGAQKTYKLISCLIKTNGFVPVLKTSYERIAFQKKTKRTRVTIDRNIVHENLLGDRKQVSLDAFVLESKVIGKTPKWHKKMVNRLSLLKQNRFSKFASGINSLYFPERGKYNFTDDEFELETMPENVTKSFDLIDKNLKLSKVEK